MASNLEGERASNCPFNTGSLTNEFTTDRFGAGKPLRNGRGSRLQGLLYHEGGWQPVRQRACQETRKLTSMMIWNQQADRRNRFATRALLSAGLVALLAAGLSLTHTDDFTAVPARSALSPTRSQDALDNAYADANRVIWRGNGFNRPRVMWGASTNIPNASNVIREQSVWINSTI